MAAVACDESVRNHSTNLLRRLLGNINSRIFPINSKKMNGICKIDQGGLHKLNGYGHEILAGVSWARVLLPLKTRRVDETIPPTDVVVRKDGCQLGVLLVTRPRFKITRSGINSPVVAL
ncbi:hypothetical protein TNCV_1307021 [Trichonephila clavipes]|nr:hypothetical protein TNCV_1307021 [Trichonephila clavipes]